MSNIYFYPKIDYDTIESPNPYIGDFEKALSKHNHIVNQEFNIMGVLDFFKYLLSAEIYLFNWIEDVPNYRYGKLQALVFVLFLGCAKMLQRKIFWVLHNKYSHDVESNKWTDFMFHLMMRYSDIILTHSKEGIDFVKENYPPQAGKVRYFIHPLKKAFPVKPSIKKKYDFLMWGTIWPYKGIDQFLAFLKDANGQPPVKVLILGRCFDQNYRKQLQSYGSDAVIFDETFYELEDIANFAAQSKFILFTHKAASVLSSGALMDSIRMNTVIIGPDNGAFRDLSRFEFVETYSNYKEIIRRLKNYEYRENLHHKEIHRFCRENSWQSFGDKLQRLISRLPGVEQTGAISSNNG